MKHKMKQKIVQVAQDPKVKKALLSLKPEKNIAGILGVVVFFILPELLAYVWGVDITLYAKEKQALASSSLTGYSYDLLIMLFEDGISWFNLILGFVLLGWLFF